MHRRRVGSLALSATMFALALGCTPVSLPKFDDGKNSSVGGFNGSNGTGGNTSTSNPTPTPAPTPTPEPDNYGTVTWQRASTTLFESITFTAGAVVNGAFVVTGGIRQTGGLSRLATSYAIGSDGSLSNRTALSNIQVNGFESGICSHGTYVFNDNLVLAGGQSDQVPYNANIVSILRSGSWAASQNAWPVTSPVDGGRQDFGYAQDAFHIFVVGGRKGPDTSGFGSPTDSILVADVNPLNGEISNWRVAGTLPQACLWNSAIVANNRLYVYGGRGDAAGESLDSVTSYAIAEDGTLSDQVAETTALTTGGTLPAQFGAAIYTRNDRIYLVGGMDENGQYANSYISVIGDDGRLSAWKTSGSLPDRVGQGAYANDGNGHFFLGGGAFEAGLTGGSTGLTNQMWYATVTD